jgi:hypothetical protein
MHGRRTEVINVDNEIDWAAADLAVLDVFLYLDRSIDQQGELFPAVGALNDAFERIMKYKSPICQYQSAKSNPKSILFPLIYCNV